MNSFLRLLAVLLLLFSFTTVIAQDETPEMVVIPGTIQSVLGCSGDWQPDCTVTALTFDEEDQLWSAEFDLPAGEYEYKVALNGSWDVNYGLGAEANGPNIPLSLAEDTTVRFIYVPASNWVTDSVNSIIANVPGNYQSEIGCADDWQPWCLQTLLQDIDGDGTYTYSTDGLPAGAYEAKVAYNETWDVNFGEGGAGDGPNIPFVVQQDNQQVTFNFDSVSHVMTILVGGEGAPAVGNLFLQQAIWITEDTIAWNGETGSDAIYRLHWSDTAELTLSEAGVEGGDSIELSLDDEGLPDAVLATNPQLSRYDVLRLAAEDLNRVPDILRSQLAVSVTVDDDSTFAGATGVQIWGVLDDLYAEAAADVPLGVTLSDGVPTLSVWAPTAQTVRLVLGDEAVDMDYDAETGIWSVTGDEDWLDQNYQYEVTVYAPTEQAIVTNLVTDPYSVSLTTNSEYSQIVSLDDPALSPPGWDDGLMTRPPLEAPEDISLYELHIRDFSIYDESVPPEHRGTYMAFTETESNGMTHLRGLAEAGLTHIHLLPAFDIATINEIADEREEPDREALAALPPDSEEQQALIEPLRDLDGFNWGYDPYHYTVPEGSYSTDPQGTTRITEFRAMVQGLHDAGLHVVMDVVYNHTNASGQNERSVLDRIVPGYYHRLSADGRVETSTCCQNTATEHRMMERLMIDSALVWVRDYGVDGFRFDLMGHHMRENMLNLRAALDALTLEEDGVDGTSIYIYGEGWNFGEVADNARGVHATQLNMAGTGIGTFSDRLRDAARGGNAFGGLQEQGFINGLYTYANGVTPGTEEEQLARLLHFSDQIRVGLAGNLAIYTLENAEGELAIGADIDYNGQPAGYTADPQENIVYVSAHDNEVLFDAIQLKAPEDATMAERVRMQLMGLSLVSFSQGIPFFHAGDDILRSKSVDRNSYNSGDWFNALDWTYTDNGWGRGLPLAGDNRERWPIVQPLLANDALAPTTDDIQFANAVFREYLQIRTSTPLFRLRTAQEVIDRLTFGNTGPDQIPGVIVMYLDDDAQAENLDPAMVRLVVIFNASPEAQTYTDDSLIGLPFALHSVQAESVDAVVRESAFDETTGGFTVPGFTTGVFVLGN